MLVATAGHIDHGKTALVRALTGIETDRLPEEKARGISIDLGFAYWRPDQGATIGFIDVPGHDRYLRNMIAGVSGAHFALLVVAGDDGIMPQTAEHLRILSLLGIHRGFAVLTKTDRVDAARIAEVERAVSTLLCSTSLAGAPVFAVSAQTGEGIAALGAALKAERVPLTKDPRHRFRLSIDRAFTVAGAGTVVTGTVLAGRAAVGDILTVSPLGREVRVRSVQTGGIGTETIGPGERCAVNLAGIDHGEIHRGDWLVEPAANAPTSRIEARLELLDCCAAPLRHDSRVHLHLGTADLRARVLAPRQRAVEPGGSATVQLVLDSPTLALSGDRLVIRDQTGSGVLGGGIVLDPLATGKRMPVAQRDARAAALALPSAEDKLAALASTPGLEADTEWLARCCNLTDSALAAMLGAGGYVRAGKDGRLILTADRFARLGGALVAGIKAHHLAYPNEGGMPLRIARAVLGEAASPELTTSVIRDLTRTGQIETSGAFLRIPGHTASFSAAETDAWRKVLAALDGQQPRAISAGELARELRTSEAAMAAMLQRRVASGDIWQVTPTKFMLRGHVAALATQADMLAASGRDGFTAASFRNASGLGRNFVIQLLEFFDRIGVTRRYGENRRMRSEWQSAAGADLLS